MNLLTKKYGAKYVLPIAMLIFGSMAMISAACTNFGGIVTTRWFLGTYPANCGVDLQCTLTIPFVLRHGRVGFLSRRDLLIIDFLHSTGVGRPLEHLLCCVTDCRSLHRYPRLRCFPNRRRNSWMAISIPYRRVIDIRRRLSSSIHPAVLEFDSVLPD